MLIFCDCKSIDSYWQKVLAKLWKNLPHFVVSNFHAVLIQKNKFISLTKNTNDVILKQR